MQLRVTRRSAEGDDELICTEIPDRPGLWSAGPVSGPPGDTLALHVSRTDGESFEAWRSGSEGVEIAPVADAGGRVLRVQMALPATVGEDVSRDVHLFPGPLTLVVRLLAVAPDEPDEAADADEHEEATAGFAGLESAAAVTGDDAVSSGQPSGARQFAEPERKIPPAPPPPPAPSEGEPATETAAPPKGSARGMLIGSVLVILVPVVVFALASLYQHFAARGAPTEEVVPAPMQVVMPEVAGSGIVRTYHQRITNRDFDAAWQCFTPQRREAISWTAWHNGYSDTVESTASDFRTLEASGDSARVECTIRYLDHIDGRRLAGTVTHIYSLRRMGGEWLIAGSESVEGSHQKQWLD